MDLIAFWNVVRDQRRVVVVGLLITLALAFMALFRVGPSGIEPRRPPIYVAKSVMFVTQSGFPWGRSAFTEYLHARGTGNGDVSVPRFADPARMEYLSALYAQLALSDSVKNVVGVKRAYDVHPVQAPDGRPLPLVEVSGYGASRLGAVDLANDVAHALQRYVASRQKASGITSATKIELPVISVAKEATVFEGIKFTAPLMLAFLGIAATLFAAFARQNVKLQRTASSVQRAAPSASHVEDAASITAVAGDAEPVQAVRGTRRPEHTLGTGPRPVSDAGKSRSARQAAGER